MMDTNHGIHCSVTSCSYNKNGDACTAKNINVGATTCNCTCSSETMCSTYTEKH